ncbi:AraC family transcriptional regulator [Actinocatenispora thailandica]|uniref:AraC family transcriptional regulator n=1 Tax=Actinocatenispora thailandica TaxID=227318 RepID=A0A7R7DQ72_9ACTN|nr:helix-turn-helix domain-containing protein [Actinocatenispora thailandica]BCJ35774.1 AraC family transcriptional regulator [Actinocatenispora thailandica]
MPATPPPPGRRPHRVAVLVRDGVVPLELGLVHQVLGRARSATGDPLYRVLTCTPVPGPVRTDADFPIVVERGPDTVGTADTVLVPAAHAPGATDETGRLDARLAATLAQRRAGSRIASICTGAFVLAAAGLLDGRRATTHWRSAPLFRTLFPAVRLDPDVLYVDEGEVLTSAGEAAGIDLCLHLVRRDHGAAVANEIARDTVVAPHREGGQAQYIRQPVPAATAATTAAVREWALAHLDRPLPLAELARRGSMSVRTFTRRFRAEVGVAPGEWLLQRRLERARELLEGTDVPVDRVAAQAGFGTAASLRAHLATALHTSPSAYRAAFRGR